MFQNPLCSIMYISNMILNRIKHVVCAISGGVDSAVASYLLKSKGYNVTAVFMKNWDITNEVGMCSADQDKEDAVYVCNKLGIPFLETNFVKQYWNEVFSELIYGYENGLTPNPDVLCNKFVKFGVFFEHVTKNLEADALATGHYAQNSLGNYLENVHNCKDSARLLMAKDKWKDQTLFLSQISQEALKKTMFPVGSLYKKEVKAIANAIGLERIVKKRESTGICFVGRRNFREFIEEYIEPKHGVFIDVENEEIVGEHKGTHYWTMGQRAELGGKSKAYFVAKINAKTQEIHVAQGTLHPALFTQEAYLGNPHWINKIPDELLNEQKFCCTFKYQHIHRQSSCDLEYLYKNKEPELKLRINRPTRSVAPGQYATFYDREECLGSARVETNGPSLYDLGERNELINYSVKNIPYESKVS